MTNNICRGDEVQRMTTKHPIDMPSKTNREIGNLDIMIDLSTKDCSKIRNNPLYKGQLSYLKEILLANTPGIDEKLLAERLDVSHKVAKLLLYDCQFNNEDEEE
ncbi:MAG: hypothetical protein FK730_04195 [Asgard group archaeon]|nr:hypothetical protein [Asgard group archaeon]